MTKIELHIKIGGLKLSQTFHVIQDLCHPDFMKQQKTCIDCGTRTLYLREFSTHVNIINVNNGLARVSKTMVIEPHCLANIPMKLSRTKRNETVLLELNGNSQKEFAVPKCLVINKPRHLFIQVANASNNSIRLTDGTIVASVSTVRTGGIYALDENVASYNSKYKHVVSICVIRKTNLSRIYE